MRLEKKKFKAAYRKLEVAGLLDTPVGTAAKQHYWRLVRRHTFAQIGSREGSG
jgi:hypothetical protein